MTARLFAAALVVALSAFTLPANAAEPVAAWDDTSVGTVEEDWDAGQEAYRAGDFARAWQHLFAAAIRDHAQAQEMLGMMRLYGPALYGPPIAADRDEAVFWLGEAARQGREPALHMHCALTEERQRSFASVAGIQTAACRAG